MGDTQRVDNWGDTTIIFMVLSLKINIINNLMVHISGTSAPIGGAGVFGLEAKFACNFVDDRRVHGSAVCAFWVCADGIVAFFF